MYIEPNTTIRLLSNVPLNNNYKHTIYFENNVKQYDYFVRKTKHVFTNLTYQRINKGVCRINRKADDCYDCNYMMFQNTGYGNMWFYAFITRVEYVSNEVCEIYFEIDLMQTWHFSYKLKECFVEREHSLTDNVGDNIVAETIDTGDIICDKMGKTGFFDSYVAVIATSYDPDGTTGGYVSGLFTGLHYVAGLIDNAEQVKTLLNFLQATTDANKSDSIVSIFVMPSKFYTTTSAPIVDVTTCSKPTDLNGYTPRNKKLLTYPYCYLNVDCGNNSAIYRYEYFKNSERAEFTLTGCVTPNPEIQLMPNNYNGAVTNWVEKLVMNGFPQVGYSIDSYRAWIAQESSAQAISLIGGLATTGASLMSGNAIGTALGTVGLANGINNIVLAQNRPPQARGNQGGSVSVATRTKDFWFRYMCVTEQYARIIDDFFDKYGYATNVVKIPNINSRPHWNYVKTNECVIVGKMPSDDIQKMCDIYDSGITFWKNGDEVGNYSLDNSPT